MGRSIYESFRHGSRRRQRRRLGILGAAYVRAMGGCERGLVDEARDEYLAKILLRRMGASGPGT